MKYRMTRHGVYALSIGVLLLALWLRPTPRAPVTVMPISSGQRVRPAAHQDTVLSLPVMVDRDGGMPLDLFAVDPPAAPVAPEPVASPPTGPPPPPDLRLLGWVLADRVPWVSVQANNTSYTLRPDEQVEDLYRYDGVREGMAVFTYLPDGTSRQYPISDVTFSD